MIWFAALGVTVVVMVPVFVAISLVSLKVGPETADWLLRWALLTVVAVLIYREMQRRQRTGGCRR